MVTPMASSQSADAPRSPQTIRRDGNRLTREPSLYLRQHGHNPIDWYPWGPEALEKARQEDRIIFLSVGYSSCHWCHVMEHEVFEHDDVREERPDIDAVYMEAVQLMTGQGGWPMTVFMTPDLKPFYGATYLPKDRFLELLDRLLKVRQTRRAELDAQSRRVTERLNLMGNLTIHDAPELDPALLAGIVTRSKELRDQTHGGFAQSQKFPTPARWRFLLREYRRDGDAELGAMITQTLEAMQGGGIRDHLGGGFHRYTVDPEWTVPHFEKMLYDNGQLASLFLEAGVALQRPDFLATAVDTLDFLLRKMRHPEGAFYASFDADSGGEEGTYYIWDEADITAEVGPTDGPALAAMLGITPQGNFEDTGRSVLTWRADAEAVAGEYGLTADLARALLPRHRQKLLAARDRRTPPALDEKIVTSWNGLVISALAQATAATGQPQYLAAGEKAMDHLLRAHRDPDGRLFRASTAGQVAGEAVLDDHAFLIDALLDLYQYGGSPERLILARRLTDQVRERFARPGGGFYQTPAEAEAPLGRRHDPFDNVIPSGNSVMLHNLIRLAAATGEPAYQQEARRQAEHATGLLSQAGFELVWTAAAARMTLDPYLSVVLAEPAGLLHGTLAARLPAHAFLCPVGPKGPSQKLLEAAPALADKTPVEQKATAYVCEYGRCRPPVHDGQTLAEQVFEGLWV